MSFKICSFLFICLLGLQINCQTKQTLDNTPNNVAQQTVEPNETDEKIKELFVDSGLGDGDGKLDELMKFPKANIIAVVQKLKENGLSKTDEQYFSWYSDEDLKMKCAYFLWELGVEREVNEKYIVDAAKTSGLINSPSKEYLMVIVSKGKKEYLPIIFEDAPKWQGAYLFIQGNFYYELENSPKPFLLYLSKESVEIRKAVYKTMALKGETYDERRSEKIKAIIKNLKKDKKMKNAAEEYLREVYKKQ